MTITQEINRLQNAKSDLKTSIESKGVNVPGADTLDNYASLVNEIETGPRVTQGIKVESYDAGGYVTSARYFGTSVPAYYLSYAGYLNGANKGWLQCGSNFVFNDNTLTSVGNAAFQYCTNLILTELPNGLITIGPYAFNGCTNINFASLPSTVTTIGEYAFSECTNLSLSSSLNNLTSLGAYAFYECENLLLSSLPAGITMIAPHVFHGCRSLPSMTCLGDLTSIGDYAFATCNSLAKLSLPNVTSVPTLGSFALKRYSALTTIEVPSALLTDFQNATNWSVYASLMVGI